MEWWDISEGRGRRVEHDEQGVVVSGLEVWHFGHERVRGVRVEEEDELERMEKEPAARRYNRAVEGSSTLIDMLIDLIVTVISQRCGW
jgi:hypothetical protein